ncbi:hypothetical protein WG907_07450 [Sphingobium sp. AN558]|uniref:hypothetical protein n=1 Tax=Sphingobium sp. AN558 TaxID=3133442 RepID=UPI0030C3ACAA
MLDKDVIRGYMINWSVISVLSLAAVAPASVSIPASRLSEGNWFYVDEADPMLGIRNLTVGVIYGTNGALTFRCDQPTSKKPKIFATFVSHEYLGQALHLQSLFVKFDEDEAWNLVGNYPGQYLASFQSSKLSGQAFERLRTANRVRIRAFRFDDVPVDADIAPSADRNLWSKFKAACSGARP